MTFHCPHATIGLALLSCLTIGNDAIAQTASFVVPTAGDSRFGFDRFAAGSTYAEWFQFERTGGGGSPAAIPDFTPQGSFGIVPSGSAAVDASNPAPGVTGGGTIINSTDFSVTAPGFFAGLGNSAVVAVQVEFSSTIDESIFATDERDAFGVPLAVVPAADPALDTATPQFIETSPLLATPSALGLVPTDVIELDRYYALAGRGGVVPTLFTTSLMLFDVPVNAPSYGVTYSIEAGAAVRSVAIDTFTAVPEPATCSLGMLALAGVAARRRR